MTPVSAIKDLVAVRWVRSAGPLGEVPLTLTNSQPGQVRLTPLDGTSMAERGRKQQGGESSDFDRWHLCNLARCRHNHFSGSEVDLCPPLRIRSPTIAQAQNHHESFPMSIPGTAREAVEASADKAQDLHASDRRRLQGIRPRDRRVTASLAFSLTPTMALRGWGVLRRSTSTWFQPRPSLEFALVIDGREC
jgi:hypothetical protein